MAQDTQNLLDELRAPTEITVVDAQREVCEALDVLHRLEVQAAKIEGLLRRAELTEEDVPLRAHMVTGRQSMGAVIRVSRDFARLTNDLIDALGGMDPWLNGHEEIRDGEKVRTPGLRKHAERAGYDPWPKR